MDPKPSDKHFNQMIETSTISEVVRLLETGTKRIFVSGPGGSGKTTLVEALQRHWRKTKRVVASVKLREVRTERDLFERFAESLGENVHFDFKGSIIRSSSHSAFDAIFAQIDDHGTDLLLLIDGFDEIKKRDVVDRFLRSASQLDNIGIVATGRETSLESRYLGIFDRNIAMEEFTIQELSGFIHQNAPDVDLTSELAGKLKSLGGGSPLVAKLLLELLPNYEIDDFISELPSQPEIIVETLISRVFAKLESEIVQSEAKEFLTVLALLGSLSTRDLSEHQLSMAHRLQQIGLVGEQRGEIEFTHVILREHFHSNRATIPSNFSLNDIVLGAEEAERDQRLGEVFRPLPGCVGLVDGTKNIVIGDRGAGKSAYFFQLPSLQQNGVSISQIQHPSNLLENLQTNGSRLSTSEEFRAGWLTIIAVELARLVPDTAPSILKSSASQLVNISSSGEPKKWSLLEFCKSLLKSNVKIKLGPITIEPSVQLAGDGRTVDLNWFLREVASYLTKDFGRLVVAIDRVDEVHKYDRELQERAVQGLFLAENEIAPIANVSALIFVRSDLYEIYDIQEKNKLVSRSLKLSWKRHELLDFLISRVVTESALPELRIMLDDYPDLNRDIALSVIFPRRIGGMVPEDWLWSSLANGNDDINPRQILLLLFLAKKYQSEAGSKIKAIPIFGESALLAAMRELSELSYKEIRDDFRVAKAFLANCRAGRLEQFKKSEIEALFDPDEGAIGDQIHQLERLGFLERILTQSEADDLHQQFRVPRLFTLGWSAGSTR